MELPFHDRFSNPKVDEDTDQAYFGSEHWQVGEREADADIAAGRVETYASMHDLLSDLLSDEE